MKKTIRKWLTSALGALSAVCLIFGGALSAQGKGAVEADAETIAMEWSNGATADASGKTTFTLRGTGNTNDRVNSTTSVKMDGLSVTIASTETINAESRFGFSFVGESNATTAPFNVMVRVPTFATNQHRIYIDDNDAMLANENGADDGNTIVYANPDESPNGGQMGVGVANGYGDTFVATNTSDYAYKFTFRDQGTYNHPQLGAYEYWSVTISIAKGTANVSGSELTVYFLESALPIDTNGNVYVSAFSQYKDGFQSNTFSITVDEMPEIDKALDDYNNVKAVGDDTAAMAVRETVLEMISTLPAADQATYTAKLDEVDSKEYRWSPREGTTIAATYNTESGYTELKPTAYGKGYTYNELVTLDGLTVTFGSNKHYQNGRYGFGLASTMGEWTLDSEHGGTETVNFVMLPKFATHSTLGTLLDGLFVCDTHETHTNIADNPDTPNVNEASAVVNTILYTDESCTTAGVCSVDGTTVNYLPSYAAENTTYEITFNKCAKGNWKVTIQIVEGSVYQVATAVAYLKAQELNFLTADGQCYITAWAATDMPQTSPFFVEILESGSAYFDTIEAADAYETAIRQGVSDLTTYKTAFEETLDGLGVYDYFKAQNQQVELETLVTVMKGFAQDASITLNDSLTLNYKLTIPDEVMADFASISVEVVVDSGEESVGAENYTYSAANFTLADGKYVLPIGKFGPQWMTATLRLDCVALDKVGELLFERHVENYSLKTYCEAVLASNPSENLKTVIVDMLNYGTAAQNYTGRNMDALANSGINQTGASSWTDTTADGITNALSGQNSETVKLTSISALLEDKVTLIAKFTSEEPLSELAASIQAGDGSTTPISITELGGGKYMVESPALTPLQYDDVYTFRAWSKIDSIVAKCTFSVNSYVKRNYEHEKAGDLVKALYLYGESVKLYAETLPTNRLTDVGFENGFLNLGTNSQNQTSDKMTTVNTSATPSWMLAQWGSTVNLVNGTKTENNGVYVFADAAKSVTVDTVNDTLTLEHKGSVEYNTGVANGWPHLLLQQDFSGDSLVRVADQKSLVMQMDYTVTACTATNSTSSSAAQFVWYVTLQNRNKDSADYGQYMWFGILLYDNRYEGAVIADYNQVDGGKADATGVMIYQPGTERWNPDTKTSPTVGQNVSLNFDILGTAKEAFNKIKQFYRDNESKYFQNATWEDLYIGSTNFGFEVSGSYDIEVEISNLGLIATRNNTVLAAQNAV